MLILHRKRNESIVIGDNIVVTIEKVSPTKIRVSIVAPPDVKIMRGELVGSENVELALSSEEMTDLK